jgi:hypothetical protein
VRLELRLGLARHPDVVGADAGSQLERLPAQLAHRRGEPGPLGGQPWVAVLLQDAADPSAGDGLPPVGLPTQVGGELPQRRLLLAADDRARAQCRASPGAGVGQGGPVGQELPELGGAGQRGAVGEVEAGLLGEVGADGGEQVEQLCELARGDRCGGPGGDGVGDDAVPVGVGGDPVRRGGRGERVAGEPGAGQLLDLGAADPAELVGEQAELLVEPVDGGGELGGGASASRGSTWPTRLWMCWMELPSRRRLSSSAPRTETVRSRMSSGTLKARTDSACSFSATTRTRWPCAT